MENNSEKRKIGVDVDEVLADTIPLLLRFHNEKYGTSLAKQDIFKYNLWEVWGGTREKAIAKFYEFYDSKYFNEIKPAFYSQKAVKRLSKNNEMIAITSRPKDIELKTKKWITKYFPNVFEEIYLTNQWSLNGKIGDKFKTKAEICRQRDIEILIEDNYEFAWGCAYTKIKVFLLDCPWNQSNHLPKNIVRVKNWKEILEGINGNCR